MKPILKFLVIVLSLCLYSCSTKDDPTQNSSKSDSLNLDFELRNPNNVWLPAIWGVGTVDVDTVGGEYFNISLDSLEKHNGKLSLKMEIASDPNGKFGVFSDSLPVASFAGKKVTYMGWIKTQDVKNGYAGLWFRVDGANNTILGFDNMSDRGLNGNREWTEVFITMDVNKYAQVIYFGGLFTGEGAAWFDDLELYVDGTKY